mmetsp:Transcript_13422/g.17576  ORF Transcript_13422/g.17576 Transcript_13422/m.17576 type:complete len:103 (+) Transcript_13422:56-364(+)
MKSLSHMFTLSGIILTLHSAYSCLHYRELVGSHTSQPPLDVVIEVSVGFVLCLIGRLSAVSFLEVQSTKSDTLFPPAYRTRDFDIYSTRLRFMVAQGGAKKS